MDQPQQLFIELRLAEHLSFANFCVGDNAAVLAALKQPLQDPHYKFIVISGVFGVGKTHLLQASCQAALAVHQTASYLPLQQAELQSMPEVLDDMDGVNVLCLDDIDSVIGKALWEEALFTIYNRVLAQNEARLILTTTKPVSALAIRLADLKSRLNAALPFRLQPLNDDHKQKLLIERAHARGLQLVPHVADFLVQHYSRALPDLLNNLKRLDEASLATQRKITIPLIKEVL